MPDGPNDTVPTPQASASDWSSEYLGGRQALEIQWRRRPAASATVEWRLFEQAATHPRLVVEDFVDPDRPKVVVDLASIYRDLKVGHGEVGLRFRSKTMELWCNVPLGPSTWIKTTLATWPAP